MKVKFLPQNIELEIKDNQSVLQLAHDNDIHIQSVCKGVPSCAECKIQIKDGEYNVIPPTTTELSLIGTAQFVDNSRLACQLRCFGNITVDLTEQIEKEERALASKRPRGAKDARAAGKSAAVEGNIIFEGKRSGNYSDTDEKVAERLMMDEEVQMLKKRLKHKKTSDKGSESSDKNKS